MRRFLFSTLIFLLLTAAGIIGQSAPTPLRDGQQVMLTGIVTMEPAGRLQFVTVKTVGAYVPIFKGDQSKKEEQREVLHEIALGGYSDYALLYAHRGQQVTVTGKMETDNATPYFWRGTRLKASSIQLADGLDLIRERDLTLDPIAADVGTYEAMVMLPADLAAPWVYSANGQPARVGHFLSCSSNGGGDVVNCFCAQGFHALQVESSRNGIHQKRQIGSERMALVEVGEDAVPQTVKITVTCSR
jgi:hypothetical protein